MDEVSRGLDEMALGAPDNNNIVPNTRRLLVSEGVGIDLEPVEACGCAELVRNDSSGTLATPLHRCKGRHHLPIIGEEMQGDQPLPKPGKPDKEESKKLEAARDSAVISSHKRLQASPERQRSEQTTSGETMEQRIPTLSASDQPTTATNPANAKGGEAATAGPQKPLDPTTVGGEESSGPHPSPEQRHTDEYAASSEDVREASVEDQPSLSTA